MFIRSKIVGGTTYYQAVESYRDGDRVRHRTVVSLATAATVPEAIQDAEHAIKVTQKRVRAARQRHPDLSLVARTTRERVERLERRLTLQTARLETLKRIAPEIE